MKELDKDSLEVLSVQTETGIYNDAGNVDAWTDFYIRWNSNLGFGVYTISVHNNGKIIGQSEYMDSKEDKAFLRLLFEKIADSIEIAD